jgi:hypothetical protein
VALSTIKPSQQLNIFIIILSWYYRKEYFEISSAEYYKVS